MTRFPDGAGGYAELAVVDADLVAAVPASMSFVEAAAAPLAGGTALTVLDRLGLGRGDRLLVLGASGGVGLFLLQLASAAGVRVVAAGRTAMHERMRALGATACVDYTTEDVPSRAVQLAGRPVDAIADLVGGTALASALPAVRNGGSVATIATPDLDLDPVLDHNLTLHGVLIRNGPALIRRVAALLADGTIRPVVSHVLPLGAAAEAHRILAGRHPGGKIVLQVAD